VRTPLVEGKKWVMSACRVQKITCDHDLFRNPLRDTVESSGLLDSLHRLWDHRCLPLQTSTQWGGTLLSRDQNQTLLLR
jgi:hypothetical protein